MIEMARSATIALSLLLISTALAQQLGYQGQQPYQGHQQQLYQGQNQFSPQQPQQQIPHSGISPQEQFVPQHQNVQQQQQVPHPGISPQLPYSPQHQNVQQQLPHPAISQQPYHYPVQGSGAPAQGHLRLRSDMPHHHPGGPVPNKKRIIISGHPPRDYLQTEPFPMPPPSQFSSRSGVLDFFKGFRGGGGGEKKSDSLPPAMRDMHRVPKPPKYPLYDLDSISMATPPPAPIMHPMASLPSDDFPVYSPTGPKQSASVNRPVRVKPGPSPTAAASSRGGYNARRGPPPSSRDHHSHGKRPKNGGGRPYRNRGPPPGHHSPRGKPPPHHNTRREKDRPQGHHGHGHGHGPSHGDQVPNQEYISSPMASNIEAIKTSPALGRPLDYNEYMAKPSHSYVNDPWNFDPFANQMNQGLNTHALKYNYDPLGMNNLEMSGGNPSMSHLDPTKLSYPGDSFVKDSENNNNNNNNVPPKPDWGGSATQQIQYHNNNNDNRNNFGQGDLTAGGSSNPQFNNNNNQNNFGNNNFNHVPEQPTRDMYRNNNDQQRNQFNNNEFNNYQGQQGNQNSNSFSNNNANNFGNNQGNNFGNNQGNNFGNNNQNNFGNNQGNNFGNNPNNFGNNNQNNFGNPNANNFGNNNFGNANPNNFANNNNNFQNNNNNFGNNNFGEPSVASSNQVVTPEKVEFTIETSMNKANGENEMTLSTSSTNEQLSNVYDPNSEQFGAPYGPNQNAYVAGDEATPTDMLPPLDQMHTNFYTDYPMNQGSNSNVVSSLSSNSNVSSNNNNSKRKKRRNHRQQNRRQENRRQVEGYQVPRNYNAHLEGIHIFNDLMNNQFTSSPQQHFLKRHVINVL